MKNEQEYLLKAKTYLPDGPVNDDLLKINLEHWYSVAASFLRLNEDEEMPPATASQVVENTVASYNAHGDEGLDGSAVGGQTYTYSDLLSKLKSVAISERKPRF